MAFSIGVWNLRALSSGRLGSPRIGMRKKSRRSRSPPKCAAETPPAEAETKNNTSKTSVQLDPKSLKAHGGLTATGFTIQCCDASQPP
jgi:hypothetical protein